LGEPDIEGEEMALPPFFILVGGVADGVLKSVMEGYLRRWDAPV
jgi:hypothetical protein